MIKTHKDLDVWKEAMKLAVDLGFIDNNDLDESVQKIRRMLVGLIKSLK